MDHIELFAAVSNFIDDLVDACSCKTRKKSSPLELYAKLIKSDQLQDGEIMNRIILPFQSFWNTYSASITDGTMADIPQDTRIHLLTKFGKESPAIFIEIGTFLKNPDLRQSIRSHLLAIGGLLTPSADVIDKLQNSLVPVSQSSSSDNDVLKSLNIDENSATGKLLCNVISSTQAALGDNPDMSDPLSVMGKLFASGALTEIFGKMKDINPAELMSMVGPLVGQLNQAAKQ